MVIGRWHAQRDGTWSWYLRLAARATAAYLAKWKIHLPAGPALAVNGLPAELAYMPMPKDPDPDPPNAGAPGGPADPGRAAGGAQVALNGAIADRTGSSSARRTRRLARALGRWLSW